MSRSKRKQPFMGNCGTSDKASKKQAHKRERKIVRQLLACDPEDEDALPQEDEISDPWDYIKDGKSRFDPQKHPEFLRK